MLARDLEERDAGGTEWTRGYSARSTGWNNSFTAV